MNSLHKKQKQIILFLGLTVLLLSIFSTTIEGVKPDNIPPVVNITDPIDGATVSDIVTITFTAEDQQNSLKEYGIKIDGVTVSTYSFSYDWDTTGYSDGTHTIEAYAHDRTTVGTDTITVTVANGGGTDDPPAVTITAPTAGATVSGTQTITVDVTDDIDTGLIADIYIDSQYVTTANSYNWDTTTYTDATHTIYAEATDSSAQTSSDEITVTVDNSGGSEPSEIFKVMCFNIKESGEDPAYPDWKEVVKEENADIIMFVETGYWDDNSNEKLNQYVNEFNNYFVNENPYVGYTTQGITYSTSGEAIMSRYPVLSTNQIGLVPLDDGTDYDVTHDFFDVEVNVGGTPIHIIGAHLKAMTGADNEQRREWEQEGIINYMDNLGNVPIIYLGDLNSFSPEDYDLNTLQSGLGYGPLSMMVPPYTNPETGGDYSTYAPVTHDYSDVFRTLNPTDWGITNPAYDSRIDFIYVNQELASHIINSTTGDTAHAATGSDHYTVDVFLDLASDGKDYIPPDVTITNPTEGAIVSDAVDITFTATDDYDIVSQRILIDDVEVATGYSYQWDTTAYSEGVHTIRCEATDNSSNIGFDEISVTVDNDGIVTGPSDILINEFLPDPYTLYSEEWIELYNPMSEAIDISGCILDDITSGGGSPYTIPAGTTITANGFLVFYQSTTGFALNNDGDTANFIDTDGTTVLDSHTYSSSSNDVSIGRETDGAATWTTFTEPTPGESNGGSSGGDVFDIVLNEYLPDPYTLYSEEWIELYNPSAYDIDLSGCILDDLIGGGTAAYTIADGTTITAGGYLVFYQSTTGLALNNDGDDVNLIATDGSTIIDSHTYSSSSNDISIGRETDGATTWTTFTEPTPGAANGDTSGGNIFDIVLNEYLPDPYTLYSEEWIELYNPSNEDVDLSGCILDDLIGGGTAAYTIADGTTITAGGYLVFYQSTTNLALNNDGDDVNLISTDGSTIIDSHSYTSSSNDVSIGRETDGAATWTTFTEPTPGAANGGGSTTSELHVNSITMTHNEKGINLNIDVTVEIFDENNNPVTNAYVTVELLYPDSSIEILSGYTGSDGKVTLAFSNTRQHGTFTATVTDVSLSGYTYNQSANIETSEQYTV